MGDGRRRRFQLGLLLAAVGGQGRRWGRADVVSRARASSPELEARRSTLVRRLARVRGGNEKLLGVGGKHLAAARLANAALTASPSLPAWRRYTGVVWDGLDVGSLPVGARRRAMSSVVVVSGLLGLVALDDPTPEYRLKIGASLAPYGKLSTWWRPKLAAPLSAWASTRFVVDLLPNDHRAACAAAHLRRRRRDLRRTHRNRSAGTTPRRRRGGSPATS